ncbi:phytoene desaturase family protein [Flavobacteriaceae bacterium]|nr:phytoene desaturase family protein [Flavobacteriaceae bacterium]MDA7717349.1 phytoene desaturase family protein [Flavobacteriaceae bacterium]MDA9213199.1 phytoene desaturase family protein [Flavobacteriaceae bacterium]MDA9373711.1 phytoene desaturase family protein [Flavobacteriaceae bacterium]MDB4005876.1 phytoene desaturase family protein [Flavobacteriaceae bacterium]
MKKAIIIGSGIGGIATALRLRSMNYNVTVFENNNYPGGKLASFDLGPYRFDAGPSLLTMPHFIDELFILFNENPRDYFNYKKKDISCKYFWDDGTKLNAYSEKSKFINEINKVLGVKESTVSTYLLKAKKKYDLTKSMFLEQSLHKLKTYLSKDLLIGLFNVFSFQINKTLNQVNELELKEPHLVQLFNRFATYNGSSPYKTPGMMTLVQHLEQEYGTYVSDKGMNNITKSLYDLALRQGIDFKFNSFVSQILVSGKRAIGVSVGEESYSSDIVVSNMDIVPTYRNLLKNHYQPEKTLSQERSSSALIFYWGINKEFKNLDLHNIFFSNDYKKEFQSIFEKKSIFSDPTVYINITSKDVKGDAPDNCENWFVMINSPNDSGQDWDNMIEEVKSNILKKINRLLNIELEDYIEYEKVYTPKTIESNTQSYMGSLYGSSSNNLMSAFLRHPNFSNKILNLYFCGGSVHPGGGIPLCLLSAKIVSQIIKNK